MKPKHSLIHRIRLGKQPSPTRIAATFAILLGSITPFFPPSGPLMSFLNGLHPKSNFLL